MRVLLFVYAVISATATAGPAFAWGKVGHKVVCQIAYEELKPEIKARADALIAIDPKFRTFAESCTWPDIFPRVRPGEHFVNVPRSLSAISSEHPCPEADRCVITAILSDMRDLAFSTDVDDQLRLLKSLGHWAGDVHQPLHVSFEDDRGGNYIAVTGACVPLDPKYPPSLHGVWDDCIIEQKLGTDYRVIAAGLRAEISADDRTHWVAANIDTAAVVSWANESLAITERPELQYCVQRNSGCWYSETSELYRAGAQRTVAVDDAYLSAEAPMVRERLKMAGVRLGAILNTVLRADIAAVR